MTVRKANSAASLDPACGPTVERLQLVLDGELPAAALGADPHTAVCAACRERIAAARLVQSALASPVESSVPPGLAGSILAAVREDRFARIRRQSYAVAGGVVVAIAASLLVMTWFPSPPQKPKFLPLGPPRVPDQAREQPRAPEPRPLRIGDEFSKVGQALIDTSNPLTGSAVSAPRVLTMISESLTRPVGPVAEFEPAVSALADLPDAARAGLEPVTATTQKAFARLLRDMGGVQVNAKPKS